MASIVELFDSRKFREGDKPTLTLHYVVYDADDATEVGQLVEDTAPFQVGALFYKTYDATPLGGGVWDVTVDYDEKIREKGADSAGGKGGPSGDNLAGSGGSNDLGGIGGPAGGGTGDSGPGGAGGGAGGGEGKQNDFGGKWSYSFSTSGGTQHITQSKGTLAFAPAGQTAPDYESAINVGKDDVQGVDITVPIFKWTETHTLPIAAVTPQYKLILFDLTGKVNQAAFRGFGIYEVLFEGVEGSIKSGEDWELTFHFTASPTVENQTIGDITVTGKHGWDYLWVRYQDAISENTKVRQPAAVYVETVYESGDFSKLGLGHGD